MENKKVALIFLYFIGAIQLVAGVYTQLVGLFHWDFMSLFRWWRWAPSRSCI